MHRITRRDLVAGFGATLAAAPLAGPALAQFGRTPTTRLVVGFPPGGSGDLFARILAGPLGEELGRSIVVDNKPGAGGLTAAEGFVRAAPDGTALLLATGSSAISAPITRKEPPYNSVTDFSWIAHLSIAPFVIAVNPKIPANDLQALVAYAKSRPGELSYSSAGIGTTVHLAGELLNERAGINVKHVPYRGSGPALVDTVSGEVAYIIETFGTLMPYHKAGTLRIITVMAEEPSKVAPEIATSRSAGIDVLAGTSNLLAAPLNTPKDKLDPIAAAVSRVMARPAIREQLLGQDIQPIADSNPDKARAYVASEIARWKPVVDRLGLAL
jgi:tripartite-type tricarboxylate transporter receptor subunit TctC